MRAASVEEGVFPAAFLAVVPVLAVVVLAAVLPASDLAATPVLLALAVPDLAAVADVVVLGAVLADPARPAVPVFGTILAGEEAGTAPVACGLTTLLGV